MKKHLKEKDGPMTLGLMETNLTYNRLHKGRGERSSALPFFLGCHAARPYDRPKIENRLIGYLPTVPYSSVHGHHICSCAWGLKKNY
ncbi:hypothetical protein GDO81_028438 [Engystomops pustulosus]|uniref:Uncharacterized protein n=1 Tax=Engystomops pustulosus TaxID=76066 RepID=A0AAV6Z330_ENGPU|nr:hypothetical protein GDO81_028438 [Engystomops pustulosus]